jgi:hypothetical protein
MGARLAGWKVDELDHVPADELVDLGTPDGASERAFDHDRRPLLLKDGAICCKKLSASVALRSLSLVAPILG